jgi:hypothetical protein
VTGVSNAPLVAEITHQTLQSNQKHDKHLNGRMQIVYVHEKLVKSCGWYVYGKGTG